MKCEEVAELLPDYLQQGLQGEQKKVVERHLESCVECREVAGLGKQLALIPDEQPSPAGRARFDAMLQAYQAGHGSEVVTRRADERAPIWSVVQWLRSPGGAVAGLDALSRHAGKPQVKKTGVDALQEQQSPLMQVALIDQLVEWRDAEAAPGLEKLRQLPNLNPTVRQRADWAISKLN